MSNPYAVPEHEAGRKLRFTPAIMEFANHCVLNCAQITNEMPAGYLERCSLFSPERERIQACAVHLAVFESHEGFDWDNLPEDWESTCARLAQLLRDCPQQPVTLEWVANVCWRTNT